MTELVVWKGFAARRDRITAMGLSRDEGELVCRVVVEGLGPVLLKEKTERETVRLYVHGVSQMNGFAGVVEADQKRREALEDLMVEELGVH